MSFVNFRCSNLVILLLWVGLGLVQPALAREDEAQTPAPSVQVGPDQEIIVIGDPFARWDGTRWLLQTQVLMPFPFKLYATRDYEMQTTALQVRLVLSCEKTYKHSKKIYEVLCHIEDVSLRANNIYRKHGHAADVLQELDTLLTGAALQIRVGEDGTVRSTDLADIEQSELGARDQYTARGKVALESVRVLLRLAMASFHMRLPDKNILKKGTWPEYRPTLFQIPAMNNTMSDAVILHRFDTWRGHHIVQSKGKGLIGVETFPDDGSDATDPNAPGQENLFSVDYSGVAIFDDVGIMTERVWALTGVITAGSTLSFGDFRYMNSGHIVRLQPDQHPDVGPSALVARPGQNPAPDELPWEPIQ